MNAKQIYYIVAENAAGKGFNANPECPDLKYIEDMTDVAYYAARTILIRRLSFESESDNRKKVILAHELGHHFENEIKSRHPSFNGLHPDLIADWFVAAIGFKDELKNYRSWGIEFNDIIEQYHDIENFVRQIDIWHTQKNCGFLIRDMKKK